jgi:hypothetical protein
MRGVHEKPTAIRPLRHRLCVIAWQQAAPHEEAQQLPACALLHRGDGVGIDPGGGTEDDPARGGRVEHAVDDDAVKMEVGIERRAEAVDEGDRAEAGRRARTRAVRAQAGLHGAQEEAQSSTLKFGVALHLAAAYPIEPWLEHFEWIEPMFNERLVMKEGRMLVPDRPGLGFSLSEQARRWTREKAEAR